MPVVVGVILHREWPSLLVPASGPILAWRPKNPRNNKAACPRMLSASCGVGWNSNPATELLYIAVDWKV